MCDIYEEIARADELELERLLKAVLERYTDLFPDWEMSAIPLQKSIDRNEQIDLFIAVLQSMKTLP